MDARTALPALALLLTACSGFPELDAFADPDDAPEPIRAAAKAVVRVGTVGSSGTGFFVSEGGELLTNNHVLGLEVCPAAGCFAKLTFDYQRGSPPSSPEEVFVIPLHVDVGLDMAILEVHTVDDAGQPAGARTAPRALSFASATAEGLIGRHVNVVGHPKARLKKWTQGDVVAAQGHWMTAAAPSLPGNSGSPILDDQGGVVGLLHRAPRSIDLVSREGENVFSVASDASALAEARGAALPDTLVSLADSMSADEVVERRLLFRNARVKTALVEGASRDVIDVLGEACDAALARDDYLSPDDLGAGLGPCTDAMSWMSCTGQGWGVCPADVDAWRARFRGVNAMQRALNGDVWLDPVSYGLQSLEATKEAGQAVGKAGLEAALAEAARPFSWSIAPYLAAFGLDDYDGGALRERVLGYRESAHYELWVPQIVSTAIGLVNREVLQQTDLDELLAELANDPVVAYGDQLMIEETRYRWKLLD